MNRVLAVLAAWLIAAGMVIWSVEANEHAMQTMPTTPTTQLLIEPYAPGQPLQHKAPMYAHITTHNVPDGRCHEDDPCWGK